MSRPHSDIAIHLTAIILTRPEVDSVVLRVANTVSVLLADFLEFYAPWERLLKLLGCHFECTQWILVHKWIRAPSDNAIGPSRAASCWHLSFIVSQPPEHFLLLDFHRLLSLEHRHLSFILLFLHSSFHFSFGWKFFLRFFLCLESTTAHLVD